METTPPREALQSPTTCMSSDVLSKLELVQCVYPCVCVYTGKQLLFLSCVLIKSSMKRIRRYLNINFQSVKAVCVFWFPPQNKKKKSTSHFIKDKQTVLHSTFWTSSLSQSNLCASDVSLFIFTFLNSIIFCWEMSAGVWELQSEEERKLAKMRTRQAYNPHQAFLKARNEIGFIWISLAF